MRSSEIAEFSDCVVAHYCETTLLRLLLDGDVESRRASALAIRILGSKLSLEHLGRSLSDPDRGVRLTADDTFRWLLTQFESDHQREQLVHVMDLNDRRQHAAALTPAMILSNQSSANCEVFHQLAICWRGLEDYEQADLAYRKCLWLCRFHYMAWQGLAACRMAADDYLGAIRALDTCLQVCPDVESARLQVRVLRRTGK